MRKLYLIFFLFTSSVFALNNTVSLLNDSPFLLRATVQSAGGKYLGGAKIAPGQQTLWVSEFKPYQLHIPGEPEVSLTPFTVIWRCEYGGFYSMCTDASPGALIRATACPGPHYCNPKEREQECPECPPCEGIYPEPGRTQE